MFKDKQIFDKFENNISWMKNVRFKLEYQHADHHFMSYVLCSNLKILNIIREPSFSANTKEIGSYMNTRLKLILSFFAFSKLH